MRRILMPAEDSLIFCKSKQGVLGRGWKSYYETNRISKTNLRRAGYPSLKDYYVQMRLVPSLQAWLGII